MADEGNAGCARPTGGLVGEETESNEQTAAPHAAKVWQEWKTGQAFE
ncbi:MAG: hypothetical protein ABFS09_09165 [Thermodesulfobacteriota bacterium]